MRVAILNITSGGMSWGYRKYIEKILPGLISHSNVSELLVGMPETIDFSEWRKDFPSVNWLTLKPSILSQVGIGNKMETVRRFNPDVIFVPTPRFINIKGIPVIYMIQNMEPLAYSNKKNPFLEKIKNWLRTREAKKAVCKGDRIIAISDFVRDFLIKQWEISDKRIDVVYHGIARNRIGNDIMKPDLIPKAWEGRFLFAAGSIRPARGLEDIISAMKELMINKADISGLVIAGDRTPVMNRYYMQLEKMIKDSDISDKITWVGKLNEKEMNWCYQNCRAFIMTSRVEACPNIALEAMSHGCICVSTDSPPMLEIFGDSAIYYGSEDWGALTSAIQTVLDWDNDQRIRASELAIKRGECFSWDICTEKTVSGLAKALESYENNKMREK